MRELSKKTWKIIALLLALAVLGTGIVGAVLYVTKSINSTITVSATGNIGLYSDAACTIPLSTWSTTWTGTEPAGTKKTLDVYVKNTGGNVAVVVRWGQTPLSSSAWIWKATQIRYEWTATVTWCAGLKDGTTELKAKEDPTPATIPLAMGAVSNKLTYYLENGQTNLPPQTINYQINFDASDA